MVSRLTCGPLMSNSSEAKATTSATTNSQRTETRILGKVRRPRRVGLMTDRNGSKRCAISPVSANGERIVNRKSLAFHSRIDLNCYSLGLPTPLLQDSKDFL